MRGTLRYLGSWSPLTVQFLLALFSFAAFALAPPARGAMLLVPLTPEARARLPMLAIEHGALLLKQGPIRGSLMVRGDRDLLAGAMLRQAILPLAAPEILCGSLPAEGRGV
jgi:hypothetical protein